MADKEKKHAELSPEGSVIQTQNGKIGDEVEGSNSSGMRKRLSDWNIERWTDQLTKEDLKCRCSRCNEMGHPCTKCPYPIHYINVPDGGSGQNQSRGAILVSFTGKNRCNRCGRRGHNRRSCHGPVFY